MQQDLAGYAKRLSVMAPRELLHRLGEQCRLLTLRARFLAGQGTKDSPYAVEEFSFCSASEPRLPQLEWEFVQEAPVVSDLLSGKWKALGFDWAWAPKENVWHRAPDTQRAWPQAFFGSISYRAGNPYGDIRLAWEPSRLQQLVALALIARSADADRSNQAVTLLEDELLSWIDANPPLTGIHYISVMECALRILSVCYALDIVRRKLRRPMKIWNGLLRLVESHASLIEKRLSLHSSTGNHTVAECAGLVYAGTLFPEFKHAGRWKKTGLAILEEEADRQILSDGSGVEQSFWYLLFIVDLCGLVVLLLQRYGETPPSGLVAAIARGKRFLNTFSDSPSDLPPIGDSDNGYALSPFLRISWNEPHETPLRRTFDATGYTVIRNEAPCLARLVFDHGALGMPPLFAHGHADALSLTLRLGAQDILIDPGTYTYNGDAQWRAYFRSTRAHNTVTVDGLDQARQTSSFMWSRPFRCQLVHREETADGGLRLLARHDGYRHLDGATHWRGVVHLASGMLLVWDYIDGNGTHDLELNWHSALPVTTEDDGYTLLGLDHPITLAIDGAESMRCRSGDANPICGWRSTCYGTKEPISTIQSRVRGPLPHEFVTRIVVGNKSASGFSAIAEIENFKRWLQ